MNLHPFDLTVIALYLAVVIGLGFYFGRIQSRREFFVVGGAMGWLAVGLSVMASLFSSNSFVFYPSAAFGNSLRIGLSLVAVSLMTPVVIWFFIPVYARLNVETTVWLGASAHHLRFGATLNTDLDSLIASVSVHLSEVIQTDASFAVFFLQSVASTARSKELSLSAAVESTDRSLSHLVACQECSPFDGNHADGSRLHWISFVTNDIRPESRAEMPVTTH